jgi:translation initiation factor 2B subunit (eIF-2B alpha/beta/delta family)/8-oxo-dGTP pyrophosphatase MutT (NUDIX family)
MPPKWLYSAGATRFTPTSYVLVFNYPYSYKLWTGKRKSNRITGYRHHLAPISGTIDSQTDATPVETAWRELKEETSLTSSTVKLWRKGRSFSFQDESVGREWTIYPFAFLHKSPSDRTEVIHSAEDCDSDDGDGIDLDWEHDFYNWHDPEEVLSRLDEKGFDATICGQKLVPHIANSLLNVYPEYMLGTTAGRRLRGGLQQLQNDHESGARELATIALNILADILIEVRPSKVRVESSEDKWGVWWRSVRLISWHIWTNGRESMGAAIGSALFSVLADLEKLYEKRACEDDIVRIVERSIGKREAMTKRLCEAFDAYLREEVIGKADMEQKTTLRVMTLSASSTIRESILHFLRRDDCDISFETLDVRVLESRPLYEGVSLASTILSSFQLIGEDVARPKINVTIYTDSSAALAARDIDVLLIGADRIAGFDGAVSNKTGSLPAILAAKHISPQVRILVISELDKVAPGESIASHHPEEDNDAEEVLCAWRLAGVKGADVIDSRMGRDGLAVKNVYFEWIPSALIDSYITDEGVMGVAGVRERSIWISQQVHRFFDNL